MKESKFIELLNLYVDHQISPAEAELLEAEVKANPERRRVYREYCQMQKACTVLAENFRTDAPGTNPKLVEFKPRRTIGAAAYVAGLMAVAAAVAVVFTARSRHVESIAATTPKVQAQVAVAVAPVTAARPALQPAFGPHVLTLREPGVDLADAANSSEPAAFGDWMSSIQFSSMPGASADDLRFDARASLQSDARNYRAGRPLQGKVEWTAFTFQK
jgi:hypothetical protein